MKKGIGSVIVLGVIGVLAVKGYGASQKRDALIARYGLAEAEVSALDSCTSALTRKKLKNGGSKSEFCGCFAKNATAKLNDEHKAAAGRFMGEMISHDAKTARAVLTPASYQGRAANVTEVALDITRGFGMCIAQTSARCEPNDQACKDRVMAALEHGKPVQR